MKFSMIGILLIVFAIPIFVFCDQKQMLPKDLTNFSQLASEFNANHDKVRIVTLLSPT